MKVKNGLKKDIAMETERMNKADKLVGHKQYIDKYGRDMPEIRNWKRDPGRI